MKTLFVLILCTLIGSTALAAPPQPTNDPADVQAIKQLQQDMGEAMVAVDMQRLQHFWADDWVAAGASGKVIDKQTLLQRFKSGAAQLRAFELGPMDVQVFGDVAMCQGSAVESRTSNGKDISGTYVWMDILKKRDGRWVVVQSIGGPAN